MKYVPIHPRMVRGKPIDQELEKQKFFKQNKKLKKMAKYTNIGLPEDLIEKIDEVIKNSKLGYKSRGEFVKEAVRRSLKELECFK